jgi:hypothetical protein
VLSQDSNLYRANTHLYRLVEFKFDYSQVRARTMKNQALKWIDGRDRCLGWIHYIDPHAPYNPEEQPFGPPIPLRARAWVPTSRSG